MKKLRNFFLAMTLLSVCVLGFGQSSFTVMSYNIRNSWANDGMNAWNKRREATVRMMRDVRPDVVGMQEVCPDQEAFLDSAIADYAHIGVGRDDGMHSGEIMSVFYDTTRIGLIDCGTFWLSETPNEPSMGWDAACKRTCTWALMFFKTSGERFLFYNTHLDHVGKVAREMEIRLIADSVKSMSVRLGISKVFMTGDFNTTTRNVIFAPLKAELSEARETSMFTDKGYTYNGFGAVDPQKETHILDSNGNTDNEVAIDHIFYKGVSVTRFDVLRGNYGAPFVSDHFPVVGMFLLQ